MTLFALVLLTGALAACGGDDSSSTSASTSAESGETESSTAATDTAPVDETVKVSAPADEPATNWKTYPALRSEDASAPLIECESWTVIHSPGKYVPIGVNVSLRFSFE